MPPRTFKEIFKVISIIYFTLVFIIVAFMGITFYLVSTGGAFDDPSELPDFFPYINYVLTPVGIGLGNFIYKKRLAELEPSASLGSKLAKFQGDMLIRTACLEAPALFAVVSTMKTGKLELLGFAGVLVVILLFWRPTPESIRYDLQLSDAEAAKLVDSDGVID